MSFVNESDVELAERYAAALREINTLREDMQWEEYDVELAERYAGALRDVAKHQN